MSLDASRRQSPIAHHVIATGLFFVVGLAASRLIYEGLFPRYLALSRPLPAFLLAALIAGLAWSGWYFLFRNRSFTPGGLPFPLALSAVLLPLLLNLLYLFDPAVDLAGSRFIFAASLWLTAVFLARLLAPDRYWSWLGIVFLWLALLPIYLLTMPNGVGRADTFEFQVVIPQLGIAHPTGYPLYILLGRLFAALPAGSVAWRINLASTVFALVAAGLIYLSGRRLWGKPVAALLAAVLFGLTPTFWSQAVEAEVYTLHALFVAASLWLMAVMLDDRRSSAACTEPVPGWPSGSWQRPIWLLALLLGLGLTNHLTTVLLVPAAVLTVWLAYGRCLRAQSWRENGRLLLKTLLALVLPLLLYAYLPLRWQAIHEEPMGWPRFVDWVIGGRFQGALQLTAWLTDGTRYEVVWRLVLSEWGWFNLLLALVGLIFAVSRNWRAALVLFLAGLAFAFYALNYYVPDLAVFLIPAHLVIALFWGAGLAGVLTVSDELLQRRSQVRAIQPVAAILVVLVVLPALLRITQNWPASNWRDRNALQTWGEGVLSMPLAQHAVVLADSEKIAPLYYLQQAEGWRPDLDIMVLPDEAAYRAELDARVNAGDTVYLARFLPGLQGVYHLRSFGPLVEVSARPLQALPVTAVPLDLDFDGLSLRGYAVEEPAMVDPEATAVTLFWQAEQPASDPRYVYVRWSGDGYQGRPATAEGAHPVGNYYPTVAWRPGEVVPDFHLLPRPVIGQSLPLDLQVALGPQFANAADLEWQTVVQVDVQPANSVASGKPFRAQNGRMLLAEAGFADEIRPGTPLPVVLAGYALLPDMLELQLVPIEEEIDRAPPTGTLVVQSRTPRPLVYAMQVNTELPNGRYYLRSSDPRTASICGWLASPSAGCKLGEVIIAGVPLPQDATNFDDKLALLDVELPEQTLQAGGTLPVNLHWQGLAPMREDYTVFLQVLNEQDQIVGQVDAWPLQGTFPTSQWQPGQIVNDPYEIQLQSDLPPGTYRLQVGLYLLATLRRLPVLDTDGRAIDDKLVVPGLEVQ